MINSFRGPNRWLSNFHSCSVEIDGMIFPSSEHAYMSFKNSDAMWKLHCQDPTIKASQIKKDGRQVTIDVPNWDDQRVSIMKRVVYAKFSQNPDLKAKLLATGNEELVEGNDWGDRFWGVDGTGENHLGKVLMEVRTELKD